MKAAIDYIASLGTRFGEGSCNHIPLVRSFFLDCITNSASRIAKAASPLRERISSGFDVIRGHESELARLFLSGIASVPEVVLYGHPKPSSGRTCTFALRSSSYPTAAAFCDALLDRGRVVAGAGHFYARYFSEDLGLEESGGYVRIGFVHYNTRDDVEKVVAVIRQLHRR